MKNELIEIKIIQLKGITNVPCRKAPALKISGAVSHRVMKSCKIQSETIKLKKSSPKTVEIENS
ncbi:hypothetical protein ACSAZK_04875 [Methanosarcina sp. Mfa9]|uniref:hypothetical protein n=1 Tax=Methanosarcina sp. Mfa9 TaxID=3439063 RepID=UPI003F850088